jgi:hypothetical protein
MILDYFVENNIRTLVASDEREMVRVLRDDVAIEVPRGAVPGFACTH